MSAIWWKDQIRVAIPTVPIEAHFGKELIERVRSYLAQCRKIAMKLSEAKVPVQTDARLSAPLARSEEHGSGI